MKFLFSKYRDTIVDWAFFAVVSQYESRYPGFVQTCPRDQDGGVDVKLLINGKEMDFPAFLERWSSEVTRLVNKRATELANAKIGDTLQRLQDVTNGACDELATIVAKVVKNITPETCAHSVAWDQHCTACSPSDE